MLWFKFFQSNPVLIFLRLINIPYHNLKQRKIKIEIVFKKKFNQDKITRYNNALSKSETKENQN